MGAAVALDSDEDLVWVAVKVMAEWDEMPDLRTTVLQTRTRWKRKQVD